MKTATPHLWWIKGYRFLRQRLQRQRFKALLKKRAPINDAWRESTGRDQNTREREPRG